MLILAFLMHLISLVAVYGLFCLQNGLLLPIMVYSERQASQGLPVLVNISISILFFALVKVVQVAFKYLLYTHLHFVSLHVK